MLMEGLNACMDRSGWKWFRQGIPRGGFAVFPKLPTQRVPSRIVADSPSGVLPCTPGTARQGKCACGASVPA
jgi:hypothetical protein